MTRCGRRMTVLGAAAGLVLGAAGSSFGQITRAGAVGTVNPVPTRASVLPSGSVHTTFRGFARHPALCRGRYVRTSGGVRGTIVYRSGVRVGVGTGIRSCRRGTCGVGYTTGYSTYPGGSLWEVDRRVYVDGSQPRVVVLPEPDVDEGIEALREGRFEVARRIYLKRSEERRDAEASGEASGIDREALRLAGFASVGARRFAEAERLLSRAYSEDESLVMEPLWGAELVGGKLEMRKLVTGAVAYAYRVDDAGAWDVVAWLMQAEGRHDLARKMATRAEAMREGATGAVESSEGEEADVKVEVATAE